MTIKLTTIDKFFIFLGLTLGTLAAVKGVYRESVPWFVVAALSYLSVLRTRVIAKYIVYLRGKIEHHENK